MSVIEYVRSKRLISLISLGMAIILCALPFILRPFYLGLCIEIIILILFGTCLSFLLTGGMLSFGHALFYGASIYTAGILLTHTSIPFPLVLIISLIVPVFLGLVVGLLCARTYGMYFATLTLTFGILGWFTIRSMRKITHGDDGIIGIEVPHIFKETSGYFIIMCVVLISLLFFWVVTKSRFGLAIQAVKENPDRVTHLGISVFRYRVLAIVISSFFAGLAGFLHFLFGGCCFPEEMFWMKSGEGVIVVLLGGEFSFFGPIIGAPIYFLIRFFTSINTEYWHLILGAIIVITMLFMPTGIVGIFKMAENMFRNHIPKKRS
jgi:branched-chain amino acid transport system permease protein